MGLSGLAMGYDVGSAQSHPSVATHLTNYVTALQALPGATPAKAKNLAAAVFPTDAEATNMPAIEELLAELVSASSGGA
jgi:hypothetical protein